MRAPAPARRTRAARAPRPARRGSSPSAASAATAASRVATPASWSEFASVLRRCANAPSTTRRTLGEVVRQRDPPERDERRVDVRRRPEDGPRDRVEPGSHRRELDRAPTPRRTPSSTERRRSGRRPRAAPSRTTARSWAGRRGSRRRSASRCCRAGSRRAWSEPGRGRERSSRRASPQCSETFGAAAISRRCGSRRSSSSTAWTWPQRVGENARQGAEARADLEGDVVRVELGEPGDDAEDVVVDEEVLAERLLGDAGRSRARQAERRARVPVDLRLERRDLVAARLRENGERVEHVGRLVPLAAQRLRREIGAVRLGEDPVGRNDRRGVSQARSPSGTSRCRRTTRSTRARQRSRAGPGPRSSGG